MRLSKKGLVMVLVAMVFPGLVLAQDKQNASKVLKKEEEKKTEFPILPVSPPPSTDLSIPSSTPLATSTPITPSGVASLAARASAAAAAAAIAAAAAETEDEAIAAEMAFMESGLSRKSGGVVNKGKYYRKPSVVTSEEASFGMETDLTLSMEDPATDPSLIPDSNPKRDSILDPIIVPMLGHTP